jgi:NAD(P)-dependent dehydrogenase (short-subunit alcohol dehydrogenase family)
MRNLKGKTAVVTGAASGIGLGMARTFAREGMAVALCDIRMDALLNATEELKRLGADAIAVQVDVSDRTSVEEAADKIEAALGPVHVVANNAGVAMHGVPIEKLAVHDWDWVIGVNVHGVINGFSVFVPRMRAHGQGGHIINTASIGGFQVRPGWHTGAYSMTKYAVVALSEALEQDLEGSGIGVSVLCPAAVNTGIYASAGSRPDRLGGPFERPENHFIYDLIKDGLSGDEVGERVIHAIREGEFYIFTHTEPQIWIEQRHRRILDAFDAADRWKARRAKSENAGEAHPNQALDTLTSVQRMPDENLAAGKGV